MNTSQKCNCCCKEDVCRYKEAYIRACTDVKAVVAGYVGVEVDIRCTMLLAHQGTKRGVNNA